MARTRKPKARAEAEYGRSYWLHGTHAVHAALANPARRRMRLLATGSGAARAAEADLWDDALKTEVVDRRMIERYLPPETTHQGIALQVEPLADATLDDVAGIEVAEARLLVLDKISDPRNVGAILRAAAAFAVAAVVVPRRGAPAEGGVLAKAASGALESVPLVRVANLARALDEIAEAGFWRLGLAAHAREGIEQARRPGRLALVMGAEGSGLRRLTIERCDALARIEMAPAMASLNVSQATAIALHATRPERL